MLLGGQTTWHPDPDIFFADGAGPLLDMGPYYLTAIVALLGPVRRVARVRVDLRRGADDRDRAAARASGSAPTTPTHTRRRSSSSERRDGHARRELRVAGAVRLDMLIYGSEGVLELPDPNFFDGQMQIRRRRGDWETVALRVARRRATPAGSGCTTWSRRSRRSGPHRASATTRHPRRRRRAVDPRLVRQRVGGRRRIDRRATRRGTGRASFAAAASGPGGDEPARRAGAGPEGAGARPRTACAFRDLNGNGELDPYEDPRLPIEERVADLLARMTLEEKAGAALPPGPRRRRTTAR